MTGETPVLRRRLGLVLLTLYGLGTTIGAGIFVLIGKVAGIAGMHAPLAFLAAAIMAGLTAFSFAELGARFPRSAGEAVYVHNAFGMPALAVVVGFAVVLAGTVSSAAITFGFAGYFRQLVDIPVPVAIAGAVIVLALIAIWGIGESVTIAALLTLLEIGALVAIIVAGLPVLGELPGKIEVIAVPTSGVAFIGVLSGAILGFYAFIGFEDMVNVAEETKDPQRTLPRAIVLTLAGTAFLYVGVSLVAVMALPMDRLAASEAPLADVFSEISGGSAMAITLIGVFAALNGALIQIIMGARILYGLARERWIPAPFGRISARTGTPVVATVVMAACVFSFAVLVPLVTLAEITSVITLLIFATVNLALMTIKRLDSSPSGHWQVPNWVPCAGLAVSAAMAAFQIVQWMG